MKNERLERWYQKLKSDPVRWNQRIQKQRDRRQLQSVKERENKQAREAWAALPADHPRKTRKPKRKPETVKAKRKRDLERLPDALVANRYLHCRVTDCPLDLIDLKREQIRLSRKLQTRIKTV